MSSPYTTLGLPPDGVAWAALGAACALLPVLYASRRRALGFGLRPEYLLPVLSVGAALLSVGYVAHYLRGGPRIIDATSYYLQARAMAHGYFAFPVPGPIGSFGGRFLLPNEHGSLSVIFPPGYAAVLALGFWAHAPMLVGPVLAGLLVLATYGLTRELTGRTDAACIAAALSASCAALRYHTADTMSHGLCALLLCVGTLWALRGARWDAALSGLALGWLVATRPVSGVVGVVLALCLLERTSRRFASFCLGLLPGILLLVLYQRAATGSYWASTQLAYYALADGPPGCFKYGFGHGIGCLFEHGDYVRARLQNGYGLHEAASNTLRRLAVHTIDIANAAPLSLLCLVGAWLGRSARGVGAIFIACIGLMLAYAPFYFDGSYPGGGTRLFADLLPLEHALLAIAIARFECAAIALPASLVGFALHASFAHSALAQREGGRPMFEAAQVKQAGIDHGLIFVDTDHGFDLGHDPGQSDAQQHVIVARYEHDAHDFVLWTRLGRPPSYRYSYSPSSACSNAKIVPYTPTPEAGARLRFEAEAEWPPLSVERGWLQPDFYPCASNGRGLRLHPSDPKLGMALDFELYPSPAPHSLRVGWVRSPGPPTVLSLTGALVTRGSSLATAQVPSGAEGCVEVELSGLPLATSPVRVHLEASRPGLLDYVEVSP